MTTHFDPRAVHPNHPQFPGRPQQFGQQQFGQQRFGQPVPPQPPFGGHAPFAPQGFPGQQFRGPVPPPPSAPLPKKRPIAGKIIGGLVAAALVVGGAGAWYTLSDATPTVQATSFAGADPTTAPFGTDHAEVATVAATGNQPGDTAGLYATTDPASCDSAAFLQQLQADPAKLAAWGGVFGLGAADVPAFVNSLSPVVLRAATSVTDHPFREGAFVEEPVVLAAGTAVLVNSYGEPTVKCFNGNPLSAGPSTEAAVTVSPTTQVVTNFRFTTVDNSRVVVVNGKPDPKPTKGPNKKPETVPTPDPVLQAQADQLKKTAEQSRTDADAKRTAAVDAGINARNGRAEADRLKGISDQANIKLGQATGALQIANQQLVAATFPFFNPAAHAAALQAVQKAQIDLQTAATEAGKAKDDFTKADTTAKDLETKQHQADLDSQKATDQATKDQDAADQAQKKADDSAKTPAEKKEEPGNGQQDPAGAKDVKELKGADDKAAGTDVQPNEKGTGTQEGTAGEAKVPGTDGTATGTGATGGTGTGTGTTGTGTTDLCTAVPGTTVPATCRTPGTTGTGTTGTTGTGTTGTGTETGTTGTTGGTGTTAGTSGRSGTDSGSTSQGGGSTGNGGSSSSEQGTDN